MRKITKVPQVGIPSMPEPVEIRWRDWMDGLNTEDDPRDLPMSAVTQLTNMDISKRGKIIDINGYSADLSNIPSGLAISRVYKYKVTKPSAQDITIVIGIKSSLVKVYAVNTTLFTQYPDSNGWHDLTEYYALSADAGTSGTTTTVTIPGFTLEDDTVKGWYIINLTQAKSSIVTASTNSVGNLTSMTTADDLGGSSGDDILIQRYPLIGYYSSGSATDYDMSYTDADDISFSLDNEDLRINFGSDGNQARGIWFGYIDRYLLDGNQNTDITTPNGICRRGWVCENQEMLRYSVKAFSGVLTTPTAASVSLTELPADDYTIRMAFMYDGNQEGPLSDYDSDLCDVTVATGDVIGYEILADLYAGFIDTGVGGWINGADTSGIQMFFSHRITDINVYISNDKANFYIVDSYVLSADSSTPTLPGSTTYYVSNLEWVARGGEFADRSGWGSYPYLAEDYPTKAMGFCSVQTMVRGRRIVGSMRQPSPEDFNEYVFRLAAAQPHSNGTFNNDVFGISLAEHIDIRTKQADAVMGLEELNGGLLVIKENSIHFIDFGGGRMDSWTIAMSNEDIGAVSRRSVERVPGGVIFAGADNIYFTDGVNTIPIADSWRTDYQNIPLATLQGSVGAYYHKLDQYRFSTGSTIYIFNIKTKAWSEDSSTTSPIDLFNDPDGNVYWLSSSQAYLMDDPDATNSIAGTVKMSEAQLDPAWIWKARKLFLTYRDADDVVTVKLSSLESGLVVTETFAATVGIERNGKRISGEFDTVVPLVTTTSNDNYSTEIHELMVELVPVRRRRAAI